PGAKIAEFQSVFEILGSLLALAIGAGFIGALSGLGGGVFIVPALVIGAHMPMTVAIGASLISVVATSAGASVAFVRDGWTNLKVAMVLECATVTGAVTGAYLAGVIPTKILELLFALMMLQSAYFSLTKQGDDLIENGDPLAKKLDLMGEIPDESGKTIHYEIVHVPGGAALMVVAGLMSGLLGIGSGALKVMAMDYIMHIPLKISSATSNFMIGVTAGAGALVFLARGDVATVIAAPVALGVTAGALIGSRILPYANVRVLRLGFVGILLLIAVEMGWRALSGI
ncbi:MAG: sulfite exporter TauE/SafE family protein, partial [Candidatus Binataceae bacterium]